MTDDAALTYLQDEGVDRGRGAEAPGDMPLRGWKDVLVRVKDQTKADNVPLLAAGVAFFALLALMPTLVALVSVYGLVADPAQIQRHIDDILQTAPAEVRELVSSQLATIVESEPAGLRLGALFGLLVALWSASTGVKYLIGAVNLAYNETETRGFFALRGLAITLAVAGIVLFVVASGGLVVLPNTLDTEGSEGALRTVMLVGRWPVFAVLALAALAVVYRWAPDRQRPRWRWVSPGAITAAVVWLVASAGLSIYTANFGRYNETYGALGTVIVVMLWLFITAYVIVVGAELNAELEHQTAMDSTTGPSQPMGERGAFVADNVGASSASPTES